MARDETLAAHNAESFTHIAELLEKHAASLRAAATMLSLEPAIPSVDVRFESNREKAIDALNGWVNEASTIAFKQRVAVSQKNGVRPQSPPQKPSTKPPKS
jgi:vacuolar-type H+-ATPase subunit I/STV1